MMSKLKQKRKLFAWYDNHLMLYYSWRTMQIFIDEKNRPIVLSLYSGATAEELANLEKLLDYLEKLCAILNSIGKMRVDKFASFVREVHLFWIEKFKKLVPLTPSLHWTLHHSKLLNICFPPN